MTMNKGKTYYPNVNASSPAGIKLQGGASTGKEGKVQKSQGKPTPMDSSKGSVADPGVNK